MDDRVPNLVQRAAERLRQPAAKTSASATAVRPASPVLGRTPPIPLESSEGSTSGKMLRPPALKPASKSVTISPASLAANGIALPAAGLSRTLQEFRALKRELMANINRDGGLPNRMVVVTSAQPGEGKTFTAANLAFALAYEKETRVLLVDADAYRHSLMQYLGVSANLGWLDVVTDTVELDDVLLHTNVPNLDLLPVGHQRDGIPELMSSSRTSSFFDELGAEDKSRIIIVDSVPCLSSTEPSILGAMAAHTMLIVAAHETARDQIEASLRVLKASRSISLVLNKTHPSLTEQFRGYGYTYGSAEQAA